MEAGTVLFQLKTYDPPVPPGHGGDESASNASLADDVPVHDHTHSFSFNSKKQFVREPGECNQHIASYQYQTTLFQISKSTASSGRSRALRDTIFHSRAMSPTGGNPEADITDESSPEFSQLGKLNQTRSARMYYNMILTTTTTTCTPVERGEYRVLSLDSIDAPK